MEMAIPACDSDYEEVDFPKCSSEDGHSWRYSHADEHLQAHHQCRICGLNTEEL